jgi:C-5 cytosine-specific DNA methylase
MKPLAIDLFCGLGGWTEGLLAEGYYVVGFDIERHVYGEHRYPAQLVIQDVLTLHGSQFKDAALIVASPPCLAYSYRAMPWKRAKALPPPDNALFEACFRIQREASEAAGRHIPMVVENVRGAQKWVGRARWNFGSFYLWGDVPALMPIPMKRIGDSVKAGDRNKGRHDGGHRWTTQWVGVEGSAIKNNGGSWFNIGSPGQKETNRNPVHELIAEGIKNKDVDGYERDHPAAFGWKKPRTSSHSKARKMASAMIAKIPLALSRHIAQSWKPMEAA